MGVQEGPEKPNEDRGFHHQGCDKSSEDFSRGVTNSYHETVLGFEAMASGAVWRMDPCGAMGGAGSTGEEASERFRSESLEA